MKKQAIGVYLWFLSISLSVRAREMLIRLVTSIIEVNRTEKHNAFLWINLREKQAEEQEVDVDS
jgi:hypothetical protein